MDTIMHASFGTGKKKCVEGDQGRYHRLLQTYMIELCHSLNSSSPDDLLQRMMHALHACSCPEKQQQQQRRYPAGTSPQPHQKLTSSGISSRSTSCTQRWRNAEGVAVHRSGRAAARRSPLGRGCGHGRNRSQESVEPAPCRHRTRNCPDQVGCRFSGTACRPESCAVPASRASVLKQMRDLYLVL